LGQIHRRQAPCSISWLRRNVSGIEHDLIGTNDAAYLFFQKWGGVAEAAFFANKKCSSLLLIRAA
jgi:hypothetical protein